MIEQKVPPTKKSTPNRYKVTIDVIHTDLTRNAWLSHANINEFIAVTCKCLIKVINTTNRGSNN